MVARPTRKNVRAAWGLVVENQPERNEEWIKGVKQLPNAGIQPLQGKIIQQGTKPVDRACQGTSNKTHREDIKVLAVEQADDQQENARGKAGAQCHNSKGRKTQCDGEFSEDGRQPKKYC